jgi:hypothetical protein
MVVEETHSNGLKSINPLTDSNITILGMPFYKKNLKYDRISDDFREEINNTNEVIVRLGKHTAGVGLTFKTNAKKLVIKVKLPNNAWMYHMPCTGEINFDMYYYLDGKYRFVNISKIGHGVNEYEYALIDNNEDSLKEILINFPLYCGVNDLEILINEDAYIEKFNRFEGKKWLFYGTSITQGGCASRPGMCYTNILSRYYNKEIINLGFSGNGLGEEVIARMINEINDLEMVFIDYDANAGALGFLESTLEPFIRILKEKNKDLKVVVVSRIRFIDSIIKGITKYEGYRLFEIDLVKRLNKELGKVYFIDGLDLLDEEEYDEYTVDCLHLTDLGFYKYCQNIIPFIDGIIKD